MADDSQTLPMSDRFSATAVQRDYDTVRTSAQRRPVVLTRHGKDDLVLLSIDEYRALVEPPRALYADETPERVLELMGLQTMAEEHGRYDDEVEEGRG